MKHEVAGVLAASYHSDLVADIKASEFTFQSGRLTIHLAREFGFCYGVDRAVDYAYQARQRFPDRPVFLTGEIIHNPHVNRQIRAQGVRFLTDPASRSTRSRRTTWSSCRPSGSPWSSSRRW
jgi:4-hydroxy-3-methylbut-2-enyl diphosphate reductase